MANQYFCKTADGSSVIPVADGSYFTDLMSASQDTADVYFAFYSDAAATIPVTPTSGTINTYGEYSDGYFLAPSTDAVVDATLVTSPIAAYTPPVMDGCSIRVRVDLTGVTGAAFFRAFAFKRG